jgi:uncharacterized protein (TIGR02001 family)
MKKARVLGALVLLSSTSLAHAEFTANAAFVSDYDFRGITQTGEEPAVQIGIDWVHASGWYVGSWASSVDFGTEDPSHEVDLYTGYSGETAGGLGWDVGILYYVYPGDSAGGFPELYGSLSYGWFTGALAYTNAYLGDYVDESAWYVAGDVGIPMGELSLALHAGYSDGDGIEQAFGDAYADYSVGLTYSANHFEVGIKWITTDADGYDDRMVLSASTSFPWK